MSRATSAKEQEFVALSPEHQRGKRDTENRSPSAFYLEPVTSKTGAHGGEDVTSSNGLYENKDVAVCMQNRMTSSVANRNPVGSAELLAALKKQKQKTDGKTEAARKPPVSAKPVVTSADYEPVDTHQDTARGNNSASAYVNVKD